MTNHHNMENENVIFNQAAIGYSLKLPALRDVNLRLHTSAIYGLFGENGSGKTTLLNTITGGIPPMAGSLTVNGFEMPCRDPRLLSKLFYVPQYPRTAALTPTAMAECYGPLYPRFSHEQFADNIKLLGVDTHRKMTKMSPGEIKKALLALAFATGCSLILLDEPLNSLDMGGKRAFQSLLARTDITDKTILISSHSAPELQNIITDVIMLYGRRVIMDSSIDALAETFTFGSTAGYCDDIVFEEGLKTIGRNHDGIYSDPDIELLYTAIHQSEYFRSIISTDHIQDDK